MIQPIMNSKPDKGTLIASATGAAVGGFGASAIFSDLYNMKSLKNVDSYVSTVIDEATKNKYTKEAGNRFAKAVEEITQNAKELYPDALKHAKKYRALYIGAGAAIGAVTLGALAHFIKNHNNEKQA